MNYASLKYDDVFREVFSHESIRKQFISDVTGIPLHSIRSVRLDSPFLWKKHRRQKQGGGNPFMRTYRGLNLRNTSDIIEIP